MYRVSPFIRRFALCLVAGLLAATLWVNIAPSGYYDFIEWRLVDLHLPAWIAPTPASLTPASLVSDGVMALFIFFLGKELWESLVLERGLLSGPQSFVLLGGVFGAALMASLIWIGVEAGFESADESSFGIGWTVPVGSDVVLSYVFGRLVFRANHPALHVLLLVSIALDILGLILLGVAHPSGGLLRLAWLALPVLASFGVWALYGRRPDPNAPERFRRRGLLLWPYIVAGVFSYIGIAAAGLPPALGLLPIIPAIPHADRSFGLFAEAEGFLHDPLNRIAHYLAPPLALVLFFFGLTRGGIDFSAFSASSAAVLAAFWLGKPLGFIAGCVLTAMITRTQFSEGIGLRDLCLVGVLLGMGFTVPVLALDTALPGGGMAEAARLGLAISLLAGPAALVLARILPK